MKKNSSSSSDAVKVPSKPASAVDTGFGPTPDRGTSDEYGVNKLGAPTKPQVAPGSPPK